MHGTCGREGAEKADEEIMVHGVAEKENRKDLMRLAWDRTIRKIGIKNLRFHDLRHEAISSFFEMGLSVPEVAMISGHKDIRMLFRYTHLRAYDIAKKLSIT